jgi:hypothetical protein
METGLFINQFVDSAAMAFSPGIQLRDPTKDRTQQALNMARMKLLFRIGGMFAFARISQFRTLSHNLAAQEWQMHVVEIAGVVQW